MANVIRGNDTVRGTDVSFIVEVDGQRYDFIHAKNFESKADINQDEVPRIGTRIVAHKNGTINYTGTATVYYMDPVVRRLFIAYKDTGYWPEIIMTVRNWDQDSRAVAQTTVHRSVQFTSLTMAKFDAESTMLDEDIEFTYDDVAFPEEFTSLPGTVL